MEKYKWKNNKVDIFNQIIIPKTNEMLFKVNLPSNAESYESGNGEGVWACGNKETFEAWEKDIDSGVYFVKMLNYSVYYPKLEYGTIVAIEMRGKKRPVAIHDELVAKYGESNW